MTDFLDTNVLVYAYDTHEPAKQIIARQILESAVFEETAALSAQVLSEFFVVVTRKISTPLTAEEAKQIISLFRRLPVAEIDGDLVEAAVVIHQQHNVSFWDGLIIAAARCLGCTRLLSEDMQTGQQIDGLVIVNPFLPV
ncbi:MAG: hypothetical protein A2511_10835 [Deltaproteobacteria bacterium RIFOXYD12_FULL_50_9]|nr:MAG: hypothetical protein A2511_10835 [Deltaproteobacteria bacterium RIFOXYD12_FULL_50_9]